MSLSSSFIIIVPPPPLYLVQLNKKISADLDDLRAQLTTAETDRNRAEKRLRQVEIRRADAERLLDDFDDGEEVCVCVSECVCVHMSAECLCIRLEMHRVRFLPSLHLALCRPPALSFVYRQSKQSTHYQGEEMEMKLRDALAQALHAKKQALGMVVKLVGKDKIMRHLGEVGSGGSGDSLAGLIREYRAGGRSGGGGGGSRRSPNRRAR